MYKLPALLRNSPRTTRDRRAAEARRWWLGATVAVRAAQSILQRVAEEGQREGWKRDGRMGDRLWGPAFLLHSSPPLRRGSPKGRPPLPTHPANPCASLHCCAAVPQDCQRQPRVGYVLQALPAAEHGAVCEDQGQAAAGQRHGVTAAHELCEKGRSLLERNACDMWQVRSWWATS